MRDNKGDMELLPQGAAKLTSKQDHFARLIALEGLSQSAAYRESYDCSPNSAPRTVWDNASQLVRHTEVAQRIAELRRGLVERTGWTKQRLVAELEDNSIRAAERHQYGASIRALELIGKAEGLFTDKPPDDRPAVTRVVVVLNEETQETRMLDAPYTVDL